MKYEAVLVSVLLAGIGLSSGAQAAPDGAALYKEKTCNACHGADGNKALLPDYPKIAGQNKAYMIKQIKDIKSGARANGNSAAMKGVLHLVNDAEIDAIADYVSKLKP
jgi:cytochrome c